MERIKPGKTERAKRRAPCGVGLRTLAHVFAMRTTITDIAKRLDIALTGANLTSASIYFSFIFIIAPIIAVTMRTHRNIFVCVENKVINIAVTVALTTAIWTSMCHKSPLLRSPTEWRYWLAFCARPADCADGVANPVHAGLGAANLIMA